MRPWQPFALALARGRPPAEEISDGHDPLAALALSVGSARYGGRARGAPPLADLGGGQPRRRQGRAICWRCETEHG
jgi:hypothetical protein